MKPKWTKIKKALQYSNAIAQELTVFTLFRRRSGGRKPLCCAIGKLLIAGGVPPEEVSGYAPTAEQRIFLQKEYGLGKREVKNIIDANDSLNHLRTAQRLPALLVKIDGMRTA